MATRPTWVSALSIPTADSAWRLSPAEAGAGAQFVPGEVLIALQPTSIQPTAREAAQPNRFAPDRTSPEWQAAARELTRLTGLAVLDLQPEHGMARLAVPTGQEAIEIARLAALPWVRAVEPNHIAHATATYPTDPAFGEQWNLQRVDAPAAWDLTRGSFSLVVALVDSGLDRTHPEFANRIMPGYDYVNGDPIPDDESGHGTHVAGILAAAYGNGIGITGLAPNVKLMPLKVLGADGSGNYYNIATAIRLAADSRAQIINLSLGGLAASTILRDAVTYVSNRNALVIAAAGNCAQGGAQCDYRLNPDFYPAAYPEALAVAASDHYDDWARYSGYKSYVALAAPGGLADDPIWSTLPGGYGFEHGTSMAAPLVSAAAALAWTFLPAASPTEIGAILKQTADKVGSAAYVGGRNDYFGFGQLNAGRAVRQAYPPSVQPVTAPQYFLLDGPLANQSVQVPLNNPSEREAQWQAAVTRPAPWLALLPTSAASTFSNPSALIMQAGPAALPVGIYTTTVVVQALPPASGIFTIPVQLQVARR